MRHANAHVWACTVYSCRCARTNASAVAPGTEQHVTGHRCLDTRSGVGLEAPNIAFILITDRTQPAVKESQTCKKLLLAGVQHIQNHNRSACSRRSQHTWMIACLPSASTTGNLAPHGLLSFAKVGLHVLCCHFCLTPEIKARHSSRTSVRQHAHSCCQRQ